jgi:hypothetical protein
MRITVIDDTAQEPGTPRKPVPGFSLKQSRNLMKIILIDQPDHKMKILII